MHLLSLDSSLPEGSVRVAAPDAAVPQPLSQAVPRSVLAGEAAAKGSPRHPRLRLCHGFHSGALCISGPVLGWLWKAKGIIMMDSAPCDLCHDSGVYGFFGRQRTRASTGWGYPGGLPGVAGACAES